MKALAGIYNVDLRVRSDPEALMISLVVPHRGAQDHDMSKYLAVGAFKHEQRVVARHHPQRASVYPSCCGQAR